MDHGNPDPGRYAEVRALLTSFGNYVARGLASIGVSEHDVLIAQPWNLLVIWGPEALRCVFSPLIGGAAEIHWVDHGNVWDEQSLTAQVGKQFGWKSVQIVRELALVMPQDRWIIAKDADRPEHQACTALRLGG